LAKGNPIIRLAVHGFVKWGHFLTAEGVAAGSVSGLIGSGQWKDVSEDLEKK
jgi:hypothetical protein